MKLYMGLFWCLATFCASASAYMANLWIEAGAAAFSCGALVLNRMHEVNRLDRRRDFRRIFCGNRKHSVTISYDCCYESAQGATMISGSSFFEAVDSTLWEKSKNNMYTEELQTLNHIAYTIHHYYTPYLLDKKVRTVSIRFNTTADRTDKINGHCAWYQPKTQRLTIIIDPTKSLSEDTIPLLLYQPFANTIHDSPIADTLTRIRKLNNRPPNWHRLTTAIMTGILVGSGSILPKISTAGSILFGGIAAAACGSSIRAMISESIAYDRAQRNLRSLLQKRAHAVFDDPEMVTLQPFAKLPLYPQLLHYKWQSTILRLYQTNILHNSPDANNAKILSKKAYSMVSRIIRDCLPDLIKNTIATEFTQPSNQDRIDAITELCLEGIQESP